jgi:hypothetical protein
MTCKYEYTAHGTVSLRARVYVLHAFRTARKIVLVIHIATHRLEPIHIKPDGH